MSTENSSVVYGIHPVSELVAQRPGDIDRICFVKGQHTGALFKLLKECRKKRLPYQMVPELRLNELCSGAKHQGVAVLCAVRSYVPFEEVAAAIDARQIPGLLVVPASVQDPRNLGSVIRSCAGFAVDGVLLEKSNTASLTDAVAKSSSGMLEHVAVVRPRSLEAVVRQLKDEGYTVVGADVRGAAHPSEVSLRGPIVLVMGGEHRGIPPYLKKLCDTTVAIPLDDKVESLNVSVATGILLYECACQRRQSAATR